MSALRYRWIGYSREYGYEPCLKYTVRTGYSYETESMRHGVRDLCICVPRDEPCATLHKPTRLHLLPMPPARDSHTKWSFFVRAPLHT